MEKRKICVIGHRNPDTDSVVSAIAYAELKKAHGCNCSPARGGRLTPQTEYVLERFGVPAPEFLPDLQPKVRHYLDSTPPTTISGSASLWEALELMDRKNLPAIPVTDEQGRFLAMLNHFSLSRAMTRKINPRCKAIIPTSVDLLVKTLNAQAVITFDSTQVVKSRILVAGSSLESFKGHIERDIPANALVLCGDRLDVLQSAIEEGARVVVLTGQTPFPRELRALAEERRVSVIISPYDTTSTAFLILYSTPCRYMTDSDVRTVLLDDAVRDIRGALAASKSRCLPVTDPDGKVVGVLAERDLVREPNMDIILVDHNELSLAVEGVDQFPILEIIDHHKLGNPPTRQPVTFVNRVVGSTSTVVAGMFNEQRVALTPQIAGLLLSGILADTLCLRSATTTEADRIAAEDLAGLLNLDVETYGKELFANSNHKGDWTVQEMLTVDAKSYDFGSRKFMVAQIESGTTDDLIKRHEEILKGLEENCRARNLVFSALMITDINWLNSILLIAGDAKFISRIQFPKRFDRTFFCRGILSRKKQLLPLLMEQLEELYGKI
ncbi:MAG: putative manganese-dependent inorganic diphosphatase [Kiritimatiellia bacterium]